MLALKIPAGPLRVQVRLVRKAVFSAFFLDFILRQPRVATQPEFGDLLFSLDMTYPSW